MYTLHIRISIYICDDRIKIKWIYQLHYIREREIIYEMKRKVGEYRE